jgi:hypothetical protein
MLEIAARSTTFSAAHFLGGRPLPQFTNIAQSVFTEATPTYVLLSFCPTILASIYLWALLTFSKDTAKSIASFTAISVAAFLVEATILLFGLFCMAMPFIPVFGGFIQPSPPLTGIQNAIFILFLTTLTCSGLLFIYMLIREFRKRHAEQGAAANP